MIVDIQVCALEGLGCYSKLIADLKTGKPGVGNIQTKINQISICFSCGGRGKKAKHSVEVYNVGSFLGYLDGAEQENL